MKRINERDALEQFDAFLDEISDPVKICGYEYSPSRALKLVDPIAYRQEFLNWADAEELEIA